MPFSSGGSGGSSSSSGARSREHTVTTSSLLAGGTQDFELSLPEGEGLIVWADLTLTNGLSNQVLVLAYDRDPAGLDPVITGPLYGSPGDSPSAFFMSGSTQAGLATSISGTAVRIPVYVRANNGTTFWIRITNSDGSNSGTFSVTFKLVPLEAE